MPDKKDRGIETYSGGFFNGLTNHLKLVLRLMGDRRVSPLVKLIPVGTLAYLVIPDLIIGPFDDAAIIGLGLYIFVELCPQDVVEEHRAALAGTIPGQWRDSQQVEDQSREGEEVIDAEFRDEP